MQASRGKTSETDLLYVMTQACDEKMMVKSPYNYYITERQSEACTVFLEDWDELMEKTLIEDRREALAIPLSQLET